jgi:4'-phosphopantetheinyl transferase
MPMHHIDVRTVAVESAPAPVWQALSALLNDAERAQAKRFVFTRHQREYVAAHALKRHMLSAGSATAPQVLTFATDPGGKPRLSQPGGPWFNLSHAERLVACAVSKTVEMIGIDVEPLGRKVSLDLARTHFAAAELRWLDLLPASERLLGFLRIWTLKEAFIKATGNGLAQPLQDFAFGFDPPDLTFLDPALGEARAWRFEQHVIGGTHLLAIAWRCEAVEASVAIREMPLAALLADASAWLGPLRVASWTT